MLPSVVNKSEEKSIFKQTYQKSVELFIFDIQKLLLECVGLNQKNAITE